MVWPKQVTLLSWTQPSGPLCLWQYLNIAQVEWEGERQSGADDSGGVQGSCQRGWQLSIRWLIVVKSQWLQFFRPSLEIWYSSFSVATSESPISMVVTFPFLIMFEDKWYGKFWVVAWLGKMRANAAYKWPEVVQGLRHRKEPLLACSCTFALAP